MIKEIVRVKLNQVKGLYDCPQTGQPATDHVS
jgi:hypothetical protein